MKTVALTRQSIRTILDELLKRSPNNYKEYEVRVNEIVENVKNQQDKALFDYSMKFDHFKLTPENICVTKEEIQEAYSLVDCRFIEILKDAVENIRSFHMKQLRNSWFDTRDDGSLLGIRFTPIDRVGVYVPGGKAAYPSSVLMNIIPAKVAGVREMIMLTPPNADGKISPKTLVAADITGINTIYKVGGAHAIAAMAFGTQSIPKVDKVVGPGNIYVALAKKAVYGYVSIDSLAGPSEILILADETANPRYIAADMLSQAEHDELASAILVTTSEELATKVSEQIAAMTEKAERKEIINQSLEQYGYILIADTMEEAISAVNEIASEHLEIMTKNPLETMTYIRNAGAIFLGDYSTESLGDYYAGPNHVIPTNGTAKFFSPLNVDDFLKKSNVISYSRDALEKVHREIEYFANQEGLAAHANSVKIRME